MLAHSLWFTLVFFLLCFLDTLSDPISSWDLKEQNDRYIFPSAP